MDRPNSHRQARTDAWKHVHDFIFVESIRVHSRKRTQNILDIALVVSAVFEQDVDEDFIINTNGHDETSLRRIVMLDSVEMLRENIGNRNAKFKSILQDGNAFIADVEEADDDLNGNGCTASISVNEVSDADESEHEAFTSDALKADRTGQAMIAPPDSESRQVIDDRESEQESQSPV